MTAHRGRDDARQEEHLTGAPSRSSPPRSTGSTSQHNLRSQIPHCSANAPSACCHGLDNHRLASIPAAWPKRSWSPMHCPRRNRRADLNSPRSDRSGHLFEAQLAEGCPSQRSPEQDNDDAGVRRSVQTTAAATAMTARCAPPDGASVQIRCGRTRADVAVVKRPGGPAARGRSSATRARIHGTLAGLCAHLDHQGQLSVEPRWRPRMGRHRTLWFWPSTPRPSRPRRVRGRGRAVYPPHLRRGDPTAGICGHSLGYDRTLEGREVVR